MIAGRFLLAVIALTSAEPAFAEDWAREVGGWTVGRSGDQCTMTMDYEGEGATRLTFMIENDAAETYLALNNYLWSAKKGDVYELRYHLGEWVYTLPSIGVTDLSRRGFVTKVNKEFLADFAKAGSLEITTAATLVDDLSLNGSAAGLRVLERCRNELARDLQQQRRDRERLAHIPADPFKSVEPTQLPVTPGARGPTPIGNWPGSIAENYPARAIRDEIEGQVGIRVDVDAAGRVAACSVLSSSGSAILDEAACNGAQRYARFTPAANEVGEPVEGSFSTTITYSLGR